MAKARVENPSNSAILSLRKEIKRLKKDLQDKDWASQKTNEGIKILYKELEQKNKELKKLDQLKSQFVANVSHEFKSPLAIIRECISLLLEGVDGVVNNNQRDSLERAVKTVDRLLRLVNDLLDIAKIESGKMKMKREEVDVANLLQDIIGEEEADMAKKSISFKKDISLTAGQIWADRDKISEIMINLLGNAIKYTSPGGKIEIKLIGAARSIRFEISNTGPGIPKNERKKIFDKFERITAEKQQGTGLGLAITRDLVTLHKGKIWVESEIGKGSTFIFTMPRSLRKPKKGASK